ncbi:PREDICTED: defensin-like protein [Ipomoea nil]|uniref:defensin-like protein n=1 Tax=Ipomoea nil TaxID=35883 RepID=UPI000901AA48|nr:PREDICTED: defensin-like protein [Ipomoea nil]
MAFSSSSSYVRLFATASLFVMLLMASEKGIMAASPTPCLSQFNGQCGQLSNSNCNTFCKSKGFANGTCNFARNICSCTKPRPC